VKQTRGTGEKCIQNGGEDNIRIDLREIGREDVDWMHVAQDRDQWWAVVNR
jgi:hypothetical protein